MVDSSSSSSTTDSTMISTSGGRTLSRRSVNLALSTVWATPSPNTANARSRRQISKGAVAVRSTTTSSQDGKNSNNLSSQRALQAVQLLPSYLGDARQVEKYDPITAPNGALQLGVAESQMLEDWLVPALQNTNGPSLSLSPDCIYYQPTHGRAEVRQLLASYMTSLLHLPQTPDVEGLVVGAGCNAVLENLCLCLAEAGDAVLIPTPYYAAFEFDLVARAQLHVQPVVTTQQYHTDDDDDDDDTASSSSSSSDASSNASSSSSDNETTTTTSLVDPSVYYPTTAALNAAYDRALDAGHPPKILLLSHPHNPLGICYPRHVVEECIEWCRANRVHLISDEIYAGSVYKADEDESGFESVLKLAATNAPDDGAAGLGLGPYIHWVYALSKDFALSGLRVGVAYSENPAIRVPLQKLNDLCQVSSQTQVWVHNLLQQKHQQVDDDTDTEEVLWTDAFRAVNHERLRARCDALTACLEECHIPYLPPTAGLFCWVDLSAYLPAAQGNTDAERERALYLELVQTFGLLFTPGHSMRHEEPGFFRIVFTAASDAEFALGLQRLRQFAAAKNGSSSPLI